MYYAGLMSGTSMDAIDVALIDVDDVVVDVIAYRQFLINRELRQRVRNIDQFASIDDITELDVILGGLFSDGILALLKDSGVAPGNINAIGCHGQTLLHLPGRGRPRTLQIGDPNIIAYRTGIPTVADFRRADLAAGGQGAPLAPAFHAFKFRSPELDRVLLNLGGMANITVLPAKPELDILGFDTGPGNVLMDLWVQHHLDEDFDAEGTWARAGCCQGRLLQNMLADPYFSAKPPKSTGKDEFNLAWIKSQIEKTAKEYKPEDIQATLLELTANTIADAINEYARRTEEVLLCGGGAHNLALTQRLDSLLPDLALKSTADHGVEPDAVEAITFAWLARQRLEGTPGNIPSVTGARKPVVLGAIYAPVKCGLCRR